MKRGAIEADKLVIWILALAGAVIIFGFIFMLNINQESEEEICRFSVLSRATSKTTTELVSLKCTTKKLCLTTGDDCKQFIGEKPTQIKLSPSNSQESADKIEETTANAMWDCWSVMGEGKLDLFGGRGGVISKLLNDADFEGVANLLNILEKEEKAKCVICSRIAVSENLQNETSILNKVDVNDYLENKQVPGSEYTYLQKFTDRQILAYPKDLSDEIEKTQASGTDEMAVLFVQFLVEDKKFLDVFEETGAELLFIGGGLIVGGVLLGPLGAIGAKGLLVSLAATGATAGVTAFQAGMQTEKERIVAATFCGPLASSKDGVYGCSMVKIVDYDDINTINKLCAGGIEGTP